MLAGVDRQIANARKRIDSNGVAALRSYRPAGFAKPAPKSAAVQLKG